MHKLTVCWVAWIKYGNISHFTAGPFIDSEAAQAAADTLNETDQHKRHTVVYSDVEVRTDYFE